MSAPNQPLQGVNTAIASGSAFGGGGGAGGPNDYAGGFNNLAIFGNLNKAGLGEEGVSNIGGGWNLEVLTGAGGLLDGALRKDGPLKGFFDAFEGKDGWFKNTMGGGSDGTSSGSGESGGGSNRPHSAVGGAAAGLVGSGAEFAGNVSPSALGNLSPSRGGVGGRGQDGPGR
jgi:hypothetical protein